jgi:5-methylcytosine-specific restriction protein A
MPRRRCLERGCGVLHNNQSRCDYHQRGRAWRKTGIPRSNYAGAWPTLRKMVLHEEPTCRLCPRPATTVDHITPLAEDGGNDRENLRALCTKCHRTKTAQDAKRGRERARPRRQGAGS